MTEPRADPHDSVDQFRARRRAATAAPQARIRQTAVTMREAAEGGDNPRF
jgi:hypothetical protein